MTRWIKPSVRRPTEPGLYRVLAELDDGTIEEQVDGWSEREWFSGTSGLPGTIIAWSEEETTDLDSQVWVLRGQRDSARAELRRWQTGCQVEGDYVTDMEARLLAERDDTRRALFRLTLEAHAALDRAGVPESLPYYGPESADCVEQMDHRSPHTLGVAERIEELRMQRDAALAELATILAERVRAATLGEER